MQKKNTLREKGHFHYDISNNFRRLISKRKQLSIYRVKELLINVGKLLLINV